MEGIKHTAKSIIALVCRLPVVKRVRFHKLFKDTPKKEQDIEEYLTKQRFSGGRECPICDGTHVQHNGRKKNNTSTTTLKPYLYW